MNERIKQLAEQAGLRFTQLMSNPMVPIVDGKETDLEKFAELLVREFIERGDVLVKHYINNHSEQEQAFLLAAIADYSNEIVKHFGVEERKDLVCPKCGVDRTLVDELQIECDRLYRIIELNGILK